MATCRCPICGRKNAGKSRNGRLHRDNDMLRNEHGKGKFGLDRRAERGLERTRKAIRNMIDEQERQCDESR
jgi:hypothetical protein